MTLLIACMLIWGMRLAWWWYALAVVLWLVESSRARKREAKRDAE